MKFDLKKYFFPNAIVILTGIILILSLIYFNTEFPPLEAGWGEGPVLSDEEAEFGTVIILLYLIASCSFLLIPVEILLKFLFNKFLLKYFDESPKEDKIEFPKFIKRSYSVLFYITFLFAFIMFIAMNIEYILNIFYK